jgi:hypothetical protein
MRTLHGTSQGLPLEEYPIGHSHSLDTFIDEDLLAFEDLWAAAGLLMRYLS